MQLLNAVFSNQKVILPVIHIKDAGQMLRNAAIAHKHGCDGIFLINHGGMSYDVLIGAYSILCKKFPDWWIGVNCLDLDPVKVFSKISQGISGVWMDNAMINENSKDQPEAIMIQKAREESGWRGLYFGGVAFKYQRPVSEWAKAARIATNYMDVVTTSGPGTGEPAYLGKIKEMKQAIGDNPLAIASGITSQNIRSYLGVVDYFLVATDISKNFWEFDPSLVKELVHRVRNYEIWNK